MKKILLMTTAMVGVAMLSTPASALDLNLGGYFRGYGVQTDNNELAGAGTSLRSFEFRRDMELHIDGETTLDNGMTVGAHGEVQIGNATPTAGNGGVGANSVSADEIYAFVSGNWGRFNLGVEDGAAYLLQVNAPSADSNIDGVRTYIQSLNYRTTQVDTNGANVFGKSALLNPTANLDYDHADQKTTDRLTYLSPKVNGFQAGVSYAPKAGLASNTGTMSLDAGTLGLHTAAAGGDVAGTYDNFYEASVRYDGEFQGVMFSAGAGWSKSTLEVSPTATQVTAVTIAATGNDYYINDDTTSWNGGLSLSMQGFTLGGSYLRAQSGRITNVDEGGAAAGGATANQAASGDITSDTYVIGGAYDNGPYHLGLSYLNQQVDYDAIGLAAYASNITKTQHETDKFTLGGGYTFGPGVTFRGSVAWGTSDHTGNSGVALGTAYAAAANNDFTQVGLGLDVQF